MWNWYQFVRYGINFVLIEQREGVTAYSKALGVHARTLEIYEQLELAQQAIEQGAIARKARMIKNGEVRAELDLSTLGEEFSKDEGDVLYAEIEQRIQQEAAFELRVHDVEWFSTYKVHSRHVSQFSKGRCFLAGDAAHVHTPVGAQGMNTGIQDGYNLAWKLALVLNGKADETILETYNQERLENAKHLLKTTDRAFDVAAGSNWLLVFLRINVLPLVFPHLIRLDPVKQFLFPLISQIGIHYRYSLLSQHAGDQSFKVKAGDRMPYFLVEGQSIYNKLHQPKFHLLMFSNTASNFDAWKTELESWETEWIDLNFIPLEPHVTEGFGMTRSFSVLLRPDNYIAAISTDTSPNQVKTYVKKAFLS